MKLVGKKLVVNLSRKKKFLKIILIILCLERKSASIPVSVLLMRVDLIIEVKLGELSSKIVGEKNFFKLFSSSINFLFTDHILLLFDSIVIIVIIVI